MDRATAEENKRRAEAALDAAARAHGEMQVKVAEATIALQKAMMNFCDAAEVLRRLPE